MLTVLIISCKPSVVPKNYLNFQSDIYLVEKRLQKITSYMKSLPVSDSNKNVNYYVENDKIFINDEEVDIDNLSNVNALSFLNENEKQDFIDNIYFLRQDDIIMCFYDKVTNNWMFGYRSIGAEDYDQVRLIALIENNSEKNISRYYNIIDSQDRVILLSPKYNSK